ncbi:transglutaminase domain-containing protein [Halalkalibacterium halodurans]|uniref:transglutaminase domain-containing protein n=1 Tax=Halalkalibacterium halodurans TaxID=86665 RepID=UPI002E236686|nr:transglutaminase domain-containing protein [Halalkalibacterium halodurans]
MIQLLPNFEIRSTGSISDAFLSLGMFRFHQAITFVAQLPYGRNTNRTEYHQVLNERKGTCSTKHALLSALCREQGVKEIKLFTGIYEMNESNTSGIGQVLTSYGLSSIPEAHCYLKYQDKCFDFTRSNGSGEFIDSFVVEHEIAPHQIGDFKLAFHRSFLEEWLSDHKLNETFDLDRLWVIREQCIEALSER